VVAPDVAQKVLHMRRAAERDEEKPPTRRGRKQKPVEVIVQALVAEQQEAAQ
jgi:hypothetical protein